MSTTTQIYDNEEESTTQLYDNEEESTTQLYEKPTFVKGKLKLYVCFDFVNHKSDNLFKTAFYLNLMKYPDLV